MNLFDILFLEPIVKFTFNYLTSYFFYELSKSSSSLSNFPVILFFLYFLVLFNSYAFGAFFRIFYRSIVKQSCETRCTCKEYELQYR